MNYRTPYYGSGSISSSTKVDPKSSYKNISIHTNPIKNGNKYWNYQKDEASNDFSPHSSHSINTPLKPQQNPIRTTSKESSSNKVESTSTFSRYSKGTDNIPFEKSVNLDSQFSAVSRIINPNGSKLLKDNLEYEEEKTGGMLNFKKKETNNFENSTSLMYNENKSSQIYKNNITVSFPYQPKMKLKRVMAGLRNIGNTCFL